VRVVVVVETGWDDHARHHAASRAPHYFLLYCADRVSRERLRHTPPGVVGEVEAQEGARMMHKLGGG